MNIYIYSDESGVFDKEHNDIFVFGGLIIINNDNKEIWSRKYSNAEKTIRQNKSVSVEYELKAAQLSNGEKSKLYRSLNQCYKFGAVVNQKQVLNNIFKSKKDKQRYLDYVYKIAVKRAFEHLIDNSVISCNEVERLYFCVDEHTTATNGKYELRESLEQEFKWGTYNQNYSCFFPPIFANLKSVEVDFCNSKTKLLVRAADIVANKIYYIAQNDRNKFSEMKNINITYFP